MKINTMMPAALRPYYRQELAASKICSNKGDFGQAWYHLERAHIIGQAYPWEHTYAHWQMLSFGIAIKSMKGVVGQVPRLLVGRVKSFVGKIPVGNTGGADVHPLKPMEIPEDLSRILAMGR